MMEKADRIKEKRRKLNLAAKNLQFEKVLAEMEAALGDEAATIVPKKPAKVKPEPEIIETVVEPVQDTGPAVLFTPNPGPQTDFLAASEDEVLFGGARGGGKALDINTLIPTPIGFKRMSEIKVNDFVFNASGKPIRVLNVIDVPEPTSCYKVDFNNGDTLIADGGHIWFTHSKTQRFNISQQFKVPEYKFSLRTTEQMYSTGGQLVGKDYAYGIPSPNPIQISGKSSIFKDVKWAYALGCHLVGGRDKVLHDPAVFSFLGKFDRYDTLGIKAMFDTIMFANDPERWQFLRGVVDQTLSATPLHKTLRLKFKNYLIAQYMQSFLATFGIRSILAVPTTFDPSDPGERGTFTLSFSTGLEIATYWKNIKLLEKHKRSLIQQYILIKAITPIDPRPCRCIEVDDPTGLYLAGSTFIPTHNSQALVVFPLRYCDHPNFKALILRRTMPELRDLIGKAVDLYLKVYPDAKFSVQENRFKFPSGATIEFGYCQYPEDLNRYKGQEYALIGVDELAQFPFYDELMIGLKGSLRTTAKGLKPQFLATANPGDVSSDKVKRDYIDQAPENTTFYQEVEVDGEVLRISKRFIKSTLKNNPALAHDKRYKAFLASLPDVKRKQWLDGDWDVCEGAAFSEFNKDIHVIPDDIIPSDWKRWRGMDWGFSKDPGCCLWGAVNPHTNQLIIYREYVFQRMNIDLVAEQLNKCELGETIQYGVGDVSMWDNRGGIGESIGQSLTRKSPRWRASSRNFVSGKSSRVMGKLRIHHYLSNDPETQQPRMLIMASCRKLIECLAGIPLDPSNGEDLDTKSPLDHYSDALKYLLQTQPFTAQESYYMRNYTGILNSSMPPPVDPVFGW